MSDTIVEAAVADFAAGNFAAVLAAARSPKAKREPDPELLYLGGKAAMRLFRPIDAVGLLQAAAMIAPFENAIWCDLGEAWYMLRQFLAADLAWANVAALAALSPGAFQRHQVARAMSGRQPLNWAGIRAATKRPVRHGWIPDPASAVPDPAERLPLMFWLGEERRGEVCLTISDGPSPDITPLILAALKTRNVHAAFFLVGHSVAGHPELVRQILADGHEIYSNGYTHDVFTNLDEDAIVSELSRTEDLLAQFRPTPTPYPVRLPGGMGWDKPHVHRAIRRWNPDAVLIHWTVDPRDQDGQAFIDVHGDPIREARVRACDVTMNPALGGSIILLHDRRIGTPHANNEYIRTLYQGIVDMIPDARLSAGRLFALQQPAREPPPIEGPTIVVRDETPKPFRVAIVGSCQVTGLADATRRFLPSAETKTWHLGVHPKESDEEILAQLQGYDLIISQTPDWDPHAPLRIGSLLERGLKAVYQPVIAFAGFHPDTIYIRNPGGSMVQGLGTEYHSLIVAAAFALGVPESRVPALFNSFVFSDLGYFEVFEAAKTALMKIFNRSGYDLAPLFDMWLRQVGQFMYTVNHPHILVLASLCRLVLARAGLIDPAAPIPEGITDALASHLIWPTYPPLAKRIGVTGSTTFLSNKATLPAGQPREMPLTDYVSGCYRIYEGLEKDVLRVADVAKACERLSTLVVN